MTQGFCRARVWANGDQEDCGAMALPGNTYCIQHRVQHLGHLSFKIRQAESDLSRLRAEYDSLLAEGQPNP